MTHKLELDAIDDRSGAEDERGKAGQDDHRIEGQQEVIVVISWKKQNKTDFRSVYKLAE